MQDGEEHYTLVDFWAAKKFVPNSIYRQVHQDNKVFLCEKQVFSDHFFSVTTKLAETCLKESEENPY